MINLILAIYFIETTEVTKSPLYEKAYKLAEQKLDEYLTEPNKESK